MATYRPIKPYGSRWNYRTPSPPPSSVIEPISPLVSVADSSILLLDRPNTLLDSDKPNTSRRLSQEEPRSDSTLSLLSSVSPPTSVSRRISPNMVQASRATSEVPTFAGNRYFDPLAFFADVALSCADPTTLPKLQELAAKDAAQRLEASPGEHFAPHSGQEVLHNDQKWDAAQKEATRRLSIASLHPREHKRYASQENDLSPKPVQAYETSPRYFLPPISGVPPPSGLGQFAHSTLYRSTNIPADSPTRSERIELAPIRDLTPPSSNASITGNGDAGSLSDNKVASALSVSPHTETAILPSPPMAVYTIVPHSADVGDVFSDSRPKRNKTTPDPDNSLAKSNDCTIPSTSTAATSTEQEIEEEVESAVQPPSCGVRGRKKGRGGKTTVTTNSATATNPSKKGKSTKTKKLKSSTPSIALRRSTRNIKYIEELESEIARSPDSAAKAPVQNSQMATEPEVAAKRLQAQDHAVGEDLTTTATPGSKTEHSNSQKESRLGVSEAESADSQAPMEAGHPVKDVEVQNLVPQSQQERAASAVSQISNSEEDKMAIVGVEQMDAMQNSIDPEGGGSGYTDIAVLQSTDHRTTEGSEPSQLCEKEDHDTPIDAFSVESNTTVAVQHAQINEMPNSNLLIDALPESAVGFLLPEYNTRQDTPSAQSLEAQIIPAVAQSGPVPHSDITPESPGPHLEREELASIIESSSPQTATGEAIKPELEEHDLDHPPPGDDAAAHSVFASKAKATDELNFQENTRCTEETTSPVPVQRFVITGTAEFEHQDESSTVAQQIEDCKATDATQQLPPSAGIIDVLPTAVETVAIGDAETDISSESPHPAGDIVCSTPKQELDPTNGAVQCTPEHDHEADHSDAAFAHERNGPEIDDGDLKMGDEGDTSAVAFAHESNGPAIDSDGDMQMSDTDLSEVSNIEDFEADRVEEAIPQSDAHHQQFVTPKSCTASPTTYRTTQPGSELAPSENAGNSPMDPSVSDSLDNEPTNHELSPSQQRTAEPPVAEVSKLMETPVPTAPNNGISECDRRSPALINPDAQTSQATAESPSNNDLCLVCGSAAFISGQANPVVGESSQEAAIGIGPPTQWIQCDSCKRWSHNGCANLSTEDVEAIDKYHCTSCEKNKGPSTLLRKSQRPKVPIDYESLNNGSTVPVQSATNRIYHPYVDKILNGEFKTIKEEFPRVVPEELSLQFFEDGGGFRLPIVIPAAVNPYPRKNKRNSAKDSQGVSAATSSAQSSNPFSEKRQFSVAVEIPVAPKEPHDVDALGMGFPENLTIRQVVDLVGPDETVEVIDVKSQQGDKRKWPLSKWVEYFEDPNRDRIYNVISLEVSKSKLGQMIQRPTIVREMDLSDQVWPMDKMKEFPSVQYYCLMSVAHAYTDWHIDFGGSSVYYRILKGRKVFFFLKPTPENLEAYQNWATSSDQSWTWLAEGRECYRVDLGPGDTMLIPSGWLHAVYTPEDSLVIGGNFLTRLHYDMQFRIHEIERATNTPMKYRFPRFARVHWYDAINLLQDDPIPPQVDEHLLAGKAANFRPSKGKGTAGNLSEWFLEGLPAFTEFLRRNSLIAQEIITEGLTKQKTEAVRSAIPKGFDDGWELVQQFARWVTWKRNCGEVIPSWAHPGADPAEGVPNAGQKKISAAAIRHMERVKADAERRASGPARPGLRERNHSSQLSPSVSDTPVPEEARVNTRKRPRQSTGEPMPPRKKGRSHKEKLDQNIIDECVKQVVANYEKSSDVFKRAMAEEVMTQYRNVHVTRLGPSRSACMPCRDGKTKCVHKDEILGLIAQVLELYHSIQGTPNIDRQEANEEFLGEHSLASEETANDEQALEVKAKSDTLQCETIAPKAGPSQPARRILPVRPAMNLIPQKVVKRLQNKAQRSNRKVSAKNRGEPKRRGGKRTACDGCRKSRRRCEHGINSPKVAGSSAATVLANSEVESDDERFIREASDIIEAVNTAEEPVSSEQGPEENTPQDDAKVESDTEESEGTPLSPYSTPSEQPDELRAQIEYEVAAIDEPQGPSPGGDMVASEEPIVSRSTTLSLSPMDGTDDDVAEKYQVITPNVKQTTITYASRAKRKRAVNTEEELSPTKRHETSFVKDTTPSPSSSKGSLKRTRATVAPLDEDESSPKNAKNDEIEKMSPNVRTTAKLRSTPRRNEATQKRVLSTQTSGEQWSSPGSDTKNTPEKLAWQEIKAAEFGLRNRSKSKSSS